jgi:prepilin-type N-terminal cleavage/methylation domain-containing protein
MKRDITIRDRGFTIIEILIVLAIAGLILTIVFIAVPQLQRNTRDSQRQNMVARLKSELEAYAANNQGQYPFLGVPQTWRPCANLAGTQQCGDWLSRYINNASSPVNIKDPSTGSNVTINIDTDGPPNWALGSVWISVGNKCGGEQFISGPGGGPNAKSYAIAIALERNGTYYCIDNG